MRDRFAGGVCFHEQAMPVSPPCAVLLATGDRPLDFSVCADLQKRCFPNALIPPRPSAGSPRCATAGTASADREVQGTEAARARACFFPPITSSEVSCEPGPSRRPKAAEGVLPFGWALWIAVNSGTYGPISMRRTFPPDDAPWRCPVLAGDTLPATLRAWPCVLGASRAVSGPPGFLVGENTARSLAKPAVGHFSQGSCLPLGGRVMPR